MGVVTATLPARAPGLRFLALAGAAPVALGLSRLLPTYGLGFRLPAFGRGRVRTPCAWCLPPAHARLAEHPLQRRVDMNRFFDPQTPSDDRGRLLQKYGAQWVLVNRSRAEDVPVSVSPRRVYQDRHCAPYRVGA